MAPERSPKKAEVACPRCGSTNAKNCGFSSRNATKRKYFCNPCARYWILGGCRLVTKVWKRSAKPMASPPPSETAAPTEVPPVEEPATKEDDAVQAEEEAVGAEGTKMVRFLEWAGEYLDQQLWLDYRVEAEREDAVTVPEEFRAPFLDKACGLGEKVGK